jgi:hypothetical protein
MKCEMADDCAGMVTHIDDKGFIYCKPHGEERKLWRRCRKLSSKELKTIKAQGAIASYEVA